MITKYRARYNVIFSVLQLVLPLGRTIVQAVRRRLPIGSTRVRSQFGSCDICDRQSDIGASFLGVLRFPMPILIPPNAPPSSITRGLVQ
jgi:hypothetical protein